MDDDDISVKAALGVVGGVIALVLALVIGLAIGKSHSPKMGQADAATATTVTTAVSSEEFVAPEPVGEALVKVYFGLSESTLPQDGQIAAVQTVVAEAQARTNAIVLVSGFHDASGDATQNVELAKQRALSVRDALIAAGMDPTRVKMSKPATTQGTGDAAEARRVEIRVQ